MINYKTTIAETIKAIDTNASFIINGEVTNENEFNNNVNFKSTPVSWSDVSAKQAELQAEYDSREYARNRKAEYDQLNQFEMQFDDKENSTTTWVDKINEIKGRHPK